MAFQAPVAPTACTTAMSESVADLESLAEKANPIVKFYDPMNLSDADFYGWGSEGTIGWLRQAEIKHGRIAMFAFVGYIVHANGIHWPWPMQTDGTGWPTGNSAPEIWDNMSTAAKWQIFFVISMLEVWDECGGGNLPHYTKGRKPGQYPNFDVLRSTIGHPLFDLYDPFGLSKNMSEEKKVRKGWSEATAIACPSTPRPLFLITSHSSLRSSPRPTASSPRSTTAASP